ncbi:MAG: alpha/beta hydrolase family protein, partial [Gammaproteobacteria bacterium]
LANHGYVPDPRRYGITAGGNDSRPGDYYRSIPELFASRGFLVVMPDYRGHNSSEGYGQIDPQTDESFLLYGEDVIALLAGISDLNRHRFGADLDNVFMWSHSMGGIVSMRVLLATDIVRASSFWSTMNVDSFAEHYSNIDGPIILQHSRDDTTTPVGNSEQFAAALTSIDHPHHFHVYDSTDHLFKEKDQNTAANRDAEFFRSLIGAGDTGGRD